MNLLSGWDISGSLNTIQILCLSVFFVCLILIIILFCLFNLYKNILKTAYEAHKELIKIAKSPVQNRLKRLNFIVKNNSNSGIENDLNIWRIEYKNLIDKTFISQQNIVLNTFSDSKYRRPTILNYRRIKKCLDETKNISIKLFAIFKQMDKILMKEFIQRDTRIQIRDVYNSLKPIVADFLKDTNFIFDKEVFIVNFQKIDLALKLINIALKKGEYSKAVNFQSVTTKEIIKTIQTIDTFYLADKLLNKTLKDKMRDLETDSNKILFTKEEIDKKQLAISVLKNKFIDYYNEIFENLKKLDSEKAFSLLSEINDMVFDFENNIKRESKIKDFFVQNFSNLNYFCESVIDSQNKLENLALENKNQGQEVSQFSSMLKLSRKEAIKIDEKWKLICKSINNIKADKGFINLEELKISLTKILEDVQNIYIEFTKIASSLRTPSSLKQEIENKVLEIQTLLSNCEVILANNMNVPEIHSFYKNINKFYEDAEIIQNIEAANELFDLIIELKNEIKNKIIKEAFAQELIIYLNRFVNNEDFESVYEQVNEAYRQNDFENSISIAINSIIKFKNN